jgi:hypothetical protein
MVWWQRVTVGSIVALIAVALFLFLPQTDRNAGVSWAGFAARVYVSLTFMALAGYAASEARNNQKADGHNRRIAMELQAVGPFIVNLPAQKQEAFIKPLADRTVRGSVSSDVEQQTLPPGTLQALSPLSRTPRARASAFSPLSPLPLAALSSPSRRRRATMPPRRGASGYRGVRACPSGAFSAEIRSGNTRLPLGTFESAHEAARAWDAAAWRLRRPRRELNFPDVPNRERAIELAPPPRVVTDEERRQHRRREQRLGIAELDEEAMAEWRRRFPHDVLDEEAFYERRREEREAERAAYREDRRTRKAAAIFNIELGEASDWPPDDPWFRDAFLESSSSSSDYGIDWDDLTSDDDE